MKNILLGETVVSRRNRDAERVVAKGKHQVLVDIADYSPTQLNRIDDAFQVALLV